MEIKRNISLKKYNTFGIDIQAKYFAVFSSSDCLAEILNSSFGINHSSLILGGGSNILFTKNYDGLVLKNEIDGIKKINEDDAYIYVKAGAGVLWHTLVMYCIEHNLAGVENLALIPGNAGAAPMQNIGAYGVEIKDVFHSLEAYHLQEKVMQTFTLADCAFGYRESVFKHQYKNQFAICSITLRLNKKPVYNTSYGAIEQELEKAGVQQLNSKAIADAVIKIRSSKLPNPAEIGNAGSFFKNPEVEKTVYEKLKNEYPTIVGYHLQNNKVKLAAGWLIEQCGWKGYRRGDAGCHAKQALVLVNYGNATGNEVYNLSEEILQSVKEKFSVTLEREVNVV